MKGNCHIQFKSHATENLKSEKACVSFEIFLNLAFQNEYGQQMGQPPPKKYHTPL